MGGEEVVVHSHRNLKALDLWQISQENTSRQSGTDKGSCYDGPGMISRESSEMPKARTAGNSIQA